MHTSRKKSGISSLPQLFHMQFSILILMRGEVYGDLWSSFSVQLPLICLLNSMRLPFSVWASFPCTLVYKVLLDRKMRGEYNSAYQFPFTQFSAACSLIP